MRNQAVGVLYSYRDNFWQKDTHYFLEDRLVARRFSRQFDRIFFVKWDHYWGWTLAYLLGCISFPWPLSNSALYILNVRNIFLNSFSFCYFSVFVDIGGVRDQFVELFCKNQNPDQSCRPTIGLRALLKRKLIKDFKKVGPILGNPSYNSQCLLFWHDLNQKMPEILIKILIKAVALP